MEKTEIPKGGAHVEPGEHLSASTLLTGESFWDEATFHEELERFYFRSWLNVGRSDQIPNPGDFSCGKSGTSRFYSFGGKTARSADSTTCAGTEGRESSAWPRAKSSDPSSVRTMHGPIQLKESSSALPIRSHLSISGERITAFTHSGPAHGADSSGRTWTIWHPTSPKKWGSSSPGSGGSRSRISASGPERPTRSRQTRKSSGRTIPSATTAPRSTRT